MSSKQLVTNVSSLKGTIQVPGDKSISHRAVMFGSIAKGKTTVTGFLPGEDCLSTINCFRKMGVRITQMGEYVEIESDGINGLKEPKDILDVGNSGTTTRLMLGILATRPFHSVLIGDESIAKRPMGRVTNPLRQMGAVIDGRENGMYTPLSIRGGDTIGIEYNSPVASAQVKSAILLAGLGSKGVTTVTEPALSRDHTERMLEAFGATIIRDGLSVSIEGGQTLTATDIEVPGDISSAAFFLVAGAIVPNSRINLKNVGMNPTRTGIVTVLQRMGAELEIMNERIVNGEPVADLTISTSNLTGIEISGDIIPALIDEIPIIALLATQADGQTVIRNAEELKVKETNRIDTVVTELKKMGAMIEATDDGMIIHGKSPLHGAEVNSYGDHRIGMMLAIAALLSKSDTILQDADAIAVSYPNFFDHLTELV
ncbi:3-phosphoshikimate 1-carboxyvinyltransferase [Schinkia azotoformans MEV2011]|uniref:3-phosphoshikimate 1-carboxyvinyltransferase n=1 Tax=Schinkia azotoformans MEV2011 TaxID=1348973 RepID=A0A072NTJ2_SCHAZ|nr:3-phosphoshikimate 1-carboxyvinyltransferase [Schinkia azotoformans]KEF40532.1 3-phosphoshikimate 1-carboxyvinyltransferase [Schinkia azotoformans MEV2011]MEC1696061.1 3-phosphoshikimate 1-carboxyvinyltransferase [Schinkia azotoformans]MEC1716725.1 3-phosphoshikimate 1-carboxyvinyltransferase [Schinkia azotoformans]MEC1725435.1 3-phosphoshikimate 1-carboxyvinyltransferase [Schinkia azotoformans]MEC1739564.1 3-phosphoshikimate 1-carboxyvinyltransferase [Schinkia azotoformans]